MKFVEDPRIKQARRGLALAWIYFFLYIGTMMILSYVLGIEPYVWGLPRWVAIGGMAVPFVFVLLLILVAEKFIPDIPLTDERESKDTC